LPSILIESLENQSFLRFFRAAESRFMPWEAHMPAPHGFDMNVRCGSEADIGEDVSGARFTPPNLVLLMAAIIDNPVRLFRFFDCNC
jgi:hypothetical protein